MTQIPEKKIINTKPFIKSVSKSEKSDLLICVEKINKEFSKINSFFVKDLSVGYEGGIKINGNLSYEKEKKLRIILNSFLGKELDIGSNSNYFWYWGKRATVPALYFSKHENIKKTRLKNAFNPNWIMEFLGFNLISGKNFVRINGDLAIINEREGTLGEKITKVTLIDEKNCRIKGHYLYANNGKMTASAEITSFQTINGFVFPNKILTTFYDESLSAEWIFKNVEVNLNLNPKIWEMPDYKNKINIGEN